jgi:hypothetical protein
VDMDRPDVPDQPGLVAAVQNSDGTRWVTFKVFAWCNQSLIERPVPLSLTINVEPESDLYRDIHAFERYGVPFTAPAGTVHGYLNLPGGLGGSFAEGSVTIGPSRANSDTYQIRLQLLDETSEPLAETLVRMEPPTVGLQQQGARAHGIEINGAFTFESLIDLETQSATFTLGHIDLTGKVPSLLLPGLRLRREFYYPHKLRIAAPYGPATHPPVSIPSTVEASSADGIVYDLVEALAVIQDHTSVQIRVPDFQEVTFGSMRRILRAAGLLRGDVISVPWQPFVAHINAGVTISTLPMTMLLYSELKLSVGAVEISLGYEQAHLPAARMDIDSVIEHEGHQDVRIVPVGDIEAVVRYQPRIPITQG